MLKSLIIILLCLTGIQSKENVAPGDQILGKWVSAEKNIIVQVYKSGDTFKGKIVWYKGDDPNKAMDEWTDKHNPDPALRSRKILGMDVLRDLKYDPKNNVWEGGMIYEARTGKEYNASAYIDKSGLLRVKGYWHFKFIGKTMLFKKA